ncbi:hypothetical protein L2E82_30058 [Cichorium intybus]|uniref:Uncharacterized protein n=1 Tax=Cichorium intybus TaxID=13427 RepID=A0ACB9CZZ8_CICIN|nr:hypothetical protein L2E82_30058 [Cichorium intybus]
MATITLPLFHTLVFFLIFSGSVVRPANGQAPGQSTWCVAKPSASEAELYNNLYYSCGYVNCDMIHPEGSCFEPQTLINQASVVMNAYYQKQGRNYWNCDFNKSALITVVDPSMANSKLSTPV